MDFAAERLLVGVDENGLGSRLGPMLVTGALAAVTCDDDTFHRAASSAGIGDSKAVCAHGSMREVEALVLGLLDSHLDLRPASFRALLDALGLHDSAWMRAPCPNETAAAACLGSDVTLPAFGAGPMAVHRSTAEGLRRAGVHLRAVRTVTTCAARLNDSRARGFSRFDVDLRAMLDLVSALRAEAGREVSAVCGKVGGRKRYDAALIDAFTLVTTESCTAARASYAVPTVGSVAFVQDADASHPIVSLASLVGKYLRELSMERIYRFYSLREKELTRVSGYHDPLTAAFVSATELLRRREGIPDACFLR